MACAVPANTPAWSGGMPGLAQNGMQRSSTTASAPPVLNSPFGRLARAGKLEFRLPLGIEHAPIGADAAFEGLPRLVECLDDRIIDTHGVRPGDEITDDLGLSHRIGHGGKAIET